MYRQDLQKSYQRDIVGSASRGVDRNVNLKSCSSGPGVHAASQLRLRVKTGMTPKDVIKEIDSLPSLPGLAGIQETSPFPLSDSAVNKLDSILAMLDEVPKELSKGDERPNFLAALVAIKNGVQRFKSRDLRERSLAPPDPLRPIPPLGLNPVALLRRSLLTFPNYTPTQLRRRILEVLASYQGEDTTAFQPDHTPGGVLGVAIGEIRKQTKILGHEGLLEIKSLPGGQSEVRLTPAAWKAIESDAGQEQRTQGVHTQG